jgi:hypothetical protein
MATAAKDMWVANLVDPWKGDSSSIAVHEFFESINEAAEMGRLSSKDKVRLARLKLRGVAKAFYSAQSHLKEEGISYSEFKAAFVNRFKDKQTDQYHYARLQNASQDRNESPEMYLDRLRKLCHRTIQRSDNPVEQAVINREAERRLLAAFINGLIGLPGRQVRLQMPDTVDKALNMAIVATNADREERNTLRGDRGFNNKVFAVGGNRENAPRDWDRNPRGKFQWSNNSRWPEHSSAGHGTRGRGAIGTRSYRTDSRTFVGGDTAPDSSRAGQRTSAGGGYGLRTEER